MSAKRIALAGLFTLLAGIAFAETVTVIKQRAAVKSKRSRVSKTLGKVRLGDKLESLGEKRGWIKVEFKGRTGYLHKSAVSGRTVRYGGSRTVGSRGTTADEATLAGKGFNDRVESEYRKKVGPAAYKAVDRMEKKQLSESEIMRFIRSGRLFEEAR